MHRSLKCLVLHCGQAEAETPSPLGARIHSTFDPITPARASHQSTDNSPPHPHPQLCDPVVDSEWRNTSSEHTCSTVPGRTVASCACPALPNRAVRSGRGCRRIPQTPSPRHANAQTRASNPERARGRTSEYAQGGVRPMSIDPPLSSLGLFKNVPHNCFQALSRLRPRGPPGRAESGHDPSRRVGY